MAADDTSAKASEVYWRSLAAMTPPERIAIGAALWEAGHRTQITGFRQLYPTADDNEILFRIAVSRFGIDLARKVYGRE